MFLFIRIRPNVNLNKMNRLTLSAGKSIISNQKYVQERLIEMTSNVRGITYIALFTAVICMISQLPGIPLPGGVPMTLQTLIIPIAGIVLGPAEGFIAALLYLILGMIGLPVFSGFTAGIGILMGATGGFLVSFPLMPLLAGLGDRAGENLSGKNTKSFVYNLCLYCGLASGAALNYLVGTVWFAAVYLGAVNRENMAAGFAACVLPFIPTAVLKVILAGVIGIVLKRTLRQAGLIT